MNNLYTEKVLSALKNADNFMICAHIYPDGDAIGSLLALGRLLDKLGKTVTLVSADGVPRDLLCLPDAARVLTPDQARNRAFSMAIAVDVSDEKRMGAAAELFFAAPQTLLIDHHATNTRFAQMNVVDGQAAATAELIVMLYDALNVPLDADAAFQLYCALQSDSGNFCFNSVRAYTFACMEKLMNAGLDLAFAARRLFLTKSRAHIAALGKAIGSMVYFADGQATCMHLSAQDKVDCGAQDADLGGIVNYALYMDGVRMCFMADEDVQGNWKYSLRALPGEDVSDIARKIIGCIKENRWHYGLVTIADTLHGSKSTKILRARLNENPYYSSCEDVPVNFIRQVMNHLVMKGYLMISDQEYHVVRLTDTSDSILNGGTILMKTPKKAPKISEEKQPKKSAASQSDIDHSLFEKLRTLRLEIARAEKVPPYIVFSDKTLVQMCLLKPKTRDEMLRVSGVGEMKYAKYGEKFLDVLKNV